MLRSSARPDTSAVAVAAATPAPARNVVLIVSDDHHWRDYGFMGHPWLRTPHLDRLARESLLFRRGSGAVGWLAYPFFVAFEWLGPVVEALGYVFAVAGFASGLVDKEFFLLFLATAIGFGVLLSTSALLLE